MVQASTMEDFEIPYRFPPAESLERWRKAALVLNSSRRFRYTADLSVLHQTRQTKKFKVGGIATQAALKFIEVARQRAKRGAGEVWQRYGFGLSAEDLAELVEREDFGSYEKHGGLTGIARKLKTSTDNGIYEVESELQMRKAVYGTNTYPELPATRFWTFVWEALQDFTLLILAFCALASLPVGISTEGWKEGWYDGAGILFSIFLVVFVTAVSDYQQSLQFRDLDKEKKKIFVDATRGSKRQKISIFDVMVGDVVNLCIGDQVPADGVFIGGFSLTIDTSALTGESKALHINSERPFLLSGTKVTDGTGSMLVTGVGMNTEWGHLMSSLVKGEEPETPLQVKLNGLATLIGKVGLLFAVFTFSVLVGRYLAQKESLQGWSGDDAFTILKYFAIAVTIIVVAVPEGLPLAVTLTLAYAMKKMMFEKALVRHLSACETMGSVTTICSDKTGTLTTNKMTAVKVWVAQKVHNVENYVCYLPDSILEHLLEAVFWNTNGDVVEDDSGCEPALIGSPTEIACLKFGLALGGRFKEVRSKSTLVRVEPFNSSKKRMGVLLRNENGSMCAYWKGAAEIVLDMCDRTVSSNGELVPIDEQLAQELHSTIKCFADQALRTLCFAYKVFEAELDHVNQSDYKIPDTSCVCVAIVGIKDPVRKGVHEAVERCFSAGIKVKMVTGDNVDTAIAIAQECGILTDGEVALGPEFRKWTPAERRKRVVNLQVLARSSPSDKLTLVKELRALGEVVAVTGDGSNDAPALLEADIGLAMGIAGTEVAKESADIVILDDNFGTIVNVAKWGRSVYINIQKFVQFQLTVNLVALVVNFSSACISGETPLTAVQLLWVNLIMDTLGALALATEPPSDDLLDRPPVGRKQAFITSVMWENVFGQVVYQLIVLAVLQYKGMNLLNLRGHDAEDQLNTMIFNAFVFCQVFNEVNARQMEKVNVCTGLMNNWIFWLVISSTVVFQAVLVEFMGKFANTVPLTKEQWLLTVSLGFFSLPVAVLVKVMRPHIRKIFKKIFTSQSSTALLSGHLQSNGYHHLAGALQ